MSRTGPTSYDVHVDAFADLDARAAYLLWALRESVFVVEQQCAYLELDGLDLEDGTRHVWVAGPDGPVGYLRVLDDDGWARVGRVLVAPAHRGTGLSEALMRTALEVIGDRPSRLAAQAPLTGWYARFGYAQDGPELLEDGILHIPMSRPARAARPA